MQMGEYAANFLLFDTRILSIQVQQLKMEKPLSGFSI